MSHCNDYAFITSFVRLGEIQTTTVYKLISALFFIKCIEVLTAESLERHFKDSSTVFSSIIFSI